jgi:hemerythrin superfamily protein
MSIFDALKRDHDEIKQLFARIDGRLEAAELGRVFARARTMVVVHSRAEEDSFYCELEEFDETEEPAERNTEEHQRIETMLDELSAGELGSAEWQRAFATMKELLLRHFASEESELFAQAKALLDAKDLARAERTYAAERERLLNEAPPVLAKTGS